MTHNFNYVCVDNRIMSLKKELENIIESFDPFDENIKSVESPNITQEMPKRGSKRINWHWINLEESKGSEKSFKKCYIM